MLALQPPSAGADLGRCERAAVVDEDRGARHHRHRGVHARPVFFGELAVTQPSLAHAADGAQHPEAQLLRGHLHAEDTGRDLAADRCVLGDVDRERRIVDDDVSMAHSTRFLVRSFGLRAEAFLSAEQFLASELLGDTSCLILILDLRMPGMDGLELQRHLASAKHRIPIIFISARTNEDERKHAIDKGAVDFLYKPFSEDALFNAIQLALSRRQNSN